MRFRKTRVLTVALEFPPESRRRDPTVSHKHSTNIPSKREKDEQMGMSAATVSHVCLLLLDGLPVQTAANSFNYLVSTRNGRHRRFPRRPQNLEAMWWLREPAAALDYRGLHGRISPATQPDISAP